MVVTEALNDVAADNDPSVEKATPLDERVLVATAKLALAVATTGDMTQVQFEGGTTVELGARLVTGLGKKVDA
jgi:hypothetical protein